MANPFDVDTGIPALGAGRRQYDVFWAAALPTPP